MKKEISNPNEIISHKIYFIRGQKVILDRDLAELYAVKTKRLKEAVRRNRERFPEDFMFEMEKAEFQNWRTQFATSKSVRRGLRYAPFCFTEQGVTMAAGVLKSKRPIEINIKIIRVFTKIRELLPDTLNLPQPISEVCSTVSHMTPEIARKILHKLQSIPVEVETDYHLSNREREVLSLLVRGYSYKMIAFKLDITYDTVRAHMKKIYEKLQVSSMTEAVAKAINQKLLRGK